MPHLPPQVRHRNQRRDRGAATAELVVTTPLLLLLILLVVQFGVWAHAIHVAHATADEGLAAARAEGASTADGQAHAEHVRQQLGRHTLANVNITITRGTDTAHVRITGQAPRVIPIPFLRLPVFAEAAGPVERFRPVPRGAAGYS